MGEFEKKIDSLVSKIMERSEGKREVVKQTTPSLIPIVFVIVLMPIIFVLAYILSGAVY